MKEESPDSQKLKIARDFCDDGIYVLLKERASGRRRAFAPTKVGSKK